MARTVHQLKVKKHQLSSFSNKKNQVNKSHRTVPLTGG
jgi:hypothetical protein